MTEPKLPNFHWIDTDRGWVDAGRVVVGAGGGATASVGRALIP